MAGIAPRACADTSGRPARDKPLKSLVWKPVPKFPIFPSGVGLERVCPSASHIGLLRIPPAVGVQSEAERRGARDSKSLVPEQQDVRTTLAGPLPRGQWQIFRNPTAHRAHVAARTPSTAS